MMLLMPFERLLITLERMYTMVCFNQICFPFFQVNMFVEEKLTESLSEYNSTGRPGITNSWNYVQVDVSIV